MPYPAHIITGRCPALILAPTDQVQMNVVRSGLLHTPPSPAIGDSSTSFAQVPADVGSSPPLRPPSLS
jgi:hypothetical protein